MDFVQILAKLLALLATSSLVNSMDKPGFNFNPMDSILGSGDNNQSFRVSALPTATTNAESEISLNLTFGNQSGILNYVHPSNSTTVTGQQEVNISQVRGRRQIGMLVRGISKDLMEDVSGSDLSTWFAYMKSVWRWMTGGEGGASSDTLRATNEMAPLTSTFIEGQIREISENQTRLLSLIEEEDRGIQVEISGLVYYGRYFLGGIVFFLSGIIVLMIYQLKIFKKELAVSS